MKDRSNSPLANFGHGGPKRPEEKLGPGFVETDIEATMGRFRGLINSVLMGAVAVPPAGLKSSIVTPSGRAMAVGAAAWPTKWVERAFSSQMVGDQPLRVSDSIVQLLTRAEVDELKRFLLSRGYRYVYSDKVRGDCVYSKTPTFGCDSFDTKTVPLWPEELK